MSLKNILSRSLLISVLILGLTGISLYSIAALVKSPVFSRLVQFTEPIEVPEEPIQLDERSAVELSSEGGKFREAEVFGCTITLTSGMGTDAQTLCINVGINSITYSIPGAVSVSVTPLPAGVISTYNSGSGILTISGTPTVDGSFNYNIVPTGGSCDGSEIPVTGTITVSPDNTVTAAPVISPVCINTTLTSFTHTTTGATGIANNGVAGANGLPAGVSAAWAGNTITISGTPTASGTFNYSIPLTGACGTVNATGTFTVTPDNTVTAAPVISPVCINTTLTSFTHTTTGATGIANNGVAGANGLPAGVSATWAGNTITISGTPTASGTFNYSIPLTGGCGTVNATGTFTVTPDNTVTAAPVISPVCINTALTSFTHTTTGATGIGAATGLPAGVSAAWAGNTITISGTPTASGTFNYSIPLTGACGTVNATGTFTVTPDNTVTAAPVISPVCINTALTSFTHTTTGATGIGAATGLPAGVSAAWAGNTITISGTPTASGTFNYSIPLTGACGTVNATGTFTVTPDNTVTAAPVISPVCINTALTSFTHTTTGATGIANNGVAGANGLPAGVSATWAGNTITISGTPTASGTFNYSIPLTGACGTVNATGTFTVTPLATVGPTSIPYPSVCISNPSALNFTQTTTGVTTIGTPTNLPPGITASFNSTTGVITFSGTATTTGLYSYSIPLTGNCINGLQATGTIDVTPEYDITAVSSVSATTIGGSASVTFYGNPATMLNGTYQIVYQIKQGSGVFTTVGPVNATVVNGKGTFSTTPVNSVTDTYTVQILTIKKSTDSCTVTLPVPPTTYFGVCSAVFGGNSTFYVPANVYSITIEVYGGGGGGDNGGGGGGSYTIRQNIPVTPGEPIAVYVGNGGPKGGYGGVSYVTRDSNIAGQLTNSLVFANGGKGSTTGNAAGGTFDPRFSGSNGNNAVGSNGGRGGGPLGGSGGGSAINGSPPGGGGGSWSGTKGVGGTGLVIISYSCPDEDITDCIKVIDDGSKSGMTVLEFTCDYTWTAPEGLYEFTTYVGSAGGGGGSGEGSGGGGSGSLIQQTFSTTSPYGLPAGSNFTITVGQGGLGAQTINANGFNGFPTSFSGSINGSAINISVAGGGGGGSQSANAGGNGSSGGGGGASPAPAKSEGMGGAATAITYTGTAIVIYQGNVGGNGDYSEPQNSVAGGGGGGLIPWKPLPADDGQNGKAAGNGQGEGGRGGDGRVLTLGDSLRYFGAGGGGVGRYFNGTDKIGLGGSAGGIRIGGSGNLSGTNPVGNPGVNKTGSGGGSGYYGGGKGGSGIVYITFVNGRILEVEYLYFNATYNSLVRSGELKWATSKEWENSHFEIERSVNDTRNWAKVGEVTGKGYSDVPVEYSFTDLNLPASGGNIFYRLRQVDLDGDFSYSLTRAIQVEALDGSTSWIAYPNPSAMRSSITVDLLDRSGYGDESILIRISDTRGIFESYSVSSPEEVSTVVNSYLDQARPGLHILQLIWGNKSEQLKLIRK